MSQNKTVKAAIFKTLQNEIDAGRLTLEQLLKPRRWGQCNDYAMIIQTIASHSGMTSEVCREETVLRYVRLFKRQKAKEYLASQNNTVV
jgi:hypothetical protein